MGAMYYLPDTRAIYIKFPCKGGLSLTLGSLCTDVLYLLSGELRHTVATTCISPTSHLLIQYVLKVRTGL